MTGGVQGAACDAAGAMASATSVAPSANVPVRSRREAVRETAAVWCMQEQQRGAESENFAVR